jgi:hypothetical protein
MCKRCGDFRIKVIQGSANIFSSYNRSHCDYMCIKTHRNEMLFDIYNNFKIQSYLDFPCCPTHDFVIAFWTMVTFHTLLT